MDVLITDRDISDERFVPHLHNKDLMVRVGEGHFNLRFDTKTMQKTPFKEQLHVVLNFDDPTSGPMWCWFMLRRGALSEDPTLSMLSSQNPVYVLLSTDVVGRVLFNIYLNLVRRKVLTGELLTVEIYGDNKSWVMGGGMYRMSMQNRAAEPQMVQFATAAEAEPAMVPQLTNMTAKRMLTNTLAQAEQALVASLQDARIGDESRELIMRYYREHITEAFKKQTP